MWGSLAGKLGAKDININATLQKLGNAVAPPAAEGEGGEYYEDEDEDYSEDEEEDDEDDSGGRGFGLVGLLTRALDDRGEEYDDEDEEDDGQYQDQDRDQRLDQRQDQHHWSQYEHEHEHEPEEGGGHDESVDDLNQNGRRTTASTDAPFPAVQVQVQGTKQGEAQPQGEAVGAESTVNDQSFSGTKAQLDNAQDQITPTQQCATEATSEIDPQQNEDPSTRGRIDLSQVAPMPGSGSKAKVNRDVTTEESQAQSPIMSTARTFDETTTLNTQVRKSDTDASSSSSRPREAPPPDHQHQYRAPTNRKGNSWEDLLERRSESNRSQTETLVRVQKEREPEIKIWEASQALHISQKPMGKTAAFECADSSGMDTVSSSSIAVGKASVPEYVAKESDDGAIKLSSEGDKSANVTETETASPSPGVSHRRTETDGSFQEPVSSSEDQSAKSYAVAKLNSECTVLREQIYSAAEETSKLKQQNIRDKEQSQALIESMMLEFQGKEARLLAAVNEDRQLEVMRMEEQYQNQIRELEERVAKERNELIKREENYRQIVEKSESRAESLSRQFDAQFSQMEQREKRSVRNAEEKLAQIMAVLDERDDEIKRLKSKTKALESTMTEHVEGAEEAEEEVMELQTENEHLQEQVGHLEAECANLKSVVASLEADAERVGGLQMELTLLREDRDRLRAQNQSATESALSSRSQLEAERDSALAECKDLKQQLAASMADLEVAQADRTRIFTANQNLEGALEAFQNERQAELDMLEEQRQEAEAETKAAHAASLEAIKQTHESELSLVQQAADSAVTTMMDEIKILETNLVKQRTENSQTRRSLDEAIHRLQTNQEDIIDRALMKNILLDWCTMKNKDKRHQVLELMASVLHFTDEEREKVHLTHLDIESMRAKVVGALAAPLPEAANPDKIEGNNVQEKWISFLLSETDDGN
mmetsp:Transcript_134056/g.199412  ORF Transcript_134056/g.199412 Transcript_134056/m.199412 type:complete len:940 (-) Transcript_134056:23-2842(-)|eukprot:CAMPEP_0117019146 /NCGR_PEP_ID=MMETSP0472-20121206/14738_1 /TAXON_ID=693140 ORGANISM="Tiarina fusus, Strain LIS" /NCGR_SAMPLE_ID=MMETSP0472 /ASSEMBLY_ACC=CAM_ASM_000603 /LENGTH=939 /DNA_ID=CAMNT_0004724047 /DNA_START=51 /DNA_END=2870 /DNA_ORIENTATION=-